MKEFNTTAVCIPSKHYMVDISEKVREIKKLVDAGRYFTINRARQYGKTTTLNQLSLALEEDYKVLSISFERITERNFSTEEAFVKAFCRLLKKKVQTVSGGLNMPETVQSRLDEFLARKDEQAGLDELFYVLEDWCAGSDCPIVMVIDEVDSATNNQVFIDFLGLLRDSYISRDTEGRAAFWSVILAGVTDVRYLKSKIRGEADAKVNSPWNIAADFNVDMSLPEKGIQSMLDEYESDRHTGMNTADIARQVWEYTNGYPYLVSRICQLMDTQMVPERFKNRAEVWTRYGVDEAVKLILAEDNTLFESLTGKLINYPKLKEKLRRILFRGETIAYVADDEEQRQLKMYGFIRNNHNTVAVSNRIFEMRLCNYFIGETDKNDDLKQAGSANKNIFVEEDGWLDVPKIMEHFIKEHNRVHKDHSESFLEEEGRERFITYISAIINGTGTYSMEEQTRDHLRTDLVVHYLGRRYIIELKIWRGERYHAKGEQQIIRYLDRYGLSTGYLLSFSFNKNKIAGVRRLQIGDKIVFEGTV